ncbi:hypothetical protein CBS101457_006063 [Exobasidium rhododendri]|nr:hypothetical protein CBS101457_006063 [Exobasidium rhododendri]
MSGFNLLPVFGAASFGKNFTDTEEMKAIYEVLLADGCHNIDTARIYGESEVLLGKTGAGSKFTIDSKTAGGFTKGVDTGKQILKNIKESVQKVGVKQIDIYYFHSPDPSLDLEDQLSGVQKAYEEGLIKRFGLSNFNAETVTKAHEIATKNGWLLPTVYQGNYNAVARKQETVLFPTLRKLGISFYAYSPIAGGFLTKTKAQVQGGKDAGRFSKGDAYSEMYHKLYNRPLLLNALENWENAAKEANVSKAEMAYRWVAFSSSLNKQHGDAIIFGASKKEQVKETLQWLKSGPLPESAVKQIESIWKDIEHEAPLDNVHF